MWFDVDDELREGLVKYYNDKIKNLKIELSKIWLRTHHWKYWEGGFDLPKRTLENCSVIKEAVRLGVGKPKQYDDQCKGYAGEDRDEPISRCKECQFNTSNND